MRRNARRRSRRGSSSLNPKIFFGITGGVIAFCAFLFVLGQIVISQNTEICKEVGLKGGLFGCNIDKKYAYPEVFLVVGNVANSPTPKLNKEESRYIINTLYNPDDENVALTIYSASSTGERINQYAHITSEDLDYEVLSQNDEDEVYFKDELDKQIYALRQTLNRVNQDISSQPRGDHVDYVTAIENAVSDADGEALIIVKGSGLSDSGFLNMTEPKLLDRISEGDSDAIINSDVFKGVMAKKDKNMKSITLYWDEMGVVSAPQMKPTQEQITAIRNIYKQIFIERGIRDKNIIIHSESRVDLNSIQTTRNVDVIRFKNDVNTWNIMLREGIDIGDAELGFDPGSAIITQGKKNAFKTNRIDLVENIKGRNLQIIGYVAISYCGATRDLALAKARADAVASLLGEMGVDKTKLSIMASEEPFFDECTDGVAEESERILNRKVVIKEG